MVTFVYWPSKLAFRDASLSNKELSSTFAFSLDSNLAFIIVAELQ